MPTLNPKNQASTIEKLEVDNSAGFKRIKRNLILMLALKTLIVGMMLFKQLENVRYWLCSFGSFNSRRGFIMLYHKSKHGEFSSFLETLGFHIKPRV